ncbi:MAG: phosphonate ABC transporter, permease protein PhnE [Alphaproteobacteria bacterium]|nr:phosphonate ABC transporter, permease protein PhnE [Alphaproteobacteria bacterium]
MQPTGGRTVDLAAMRARYPGAFGGTARRAAAAAIAGALVALVLFGFWRLEFSPARLIDGVANLGVFLELMVPPHPGSAARALIYLHALGETVAIALLGTFSAAILALPLGLLAAHNVVANRIVHILSRRCLDAIRGVDTLIWALIWINVVGLGPFAGALAIMTSEFGTFGKLFSEAIEAADRRPGEGVLAAGADPLQRVRFGILPQVMPVMLSQVLYYFESNTRSATIIGIVGAGGIGLHLAEQIRTLEWHQAAFIVLMILAAVTAIDFASGKLRFAIIGRRPVALA